MIDYVPDLLSWYEIYRFDERLDKWVKWNSVDFDRYGQKFVDNQIKYCQQSYPNQKIRILRINRTLIQEINAPVM